MDRQAAIDAIVRHADDIRARGVAHLFLFGSTVRGESGGDSDVDIFVDLREGARFSLFDLMDLREHLTRVLGRRADVLTRHSLHRVIRGDIEREALRVF
jgi:predicted nucleotidyltransferase